MFYYTFYQLNKFIAQLQTCVEFLTNIFCFLSLFEIDSVLLFSIAFAIYSIMASQVQVSELTKGISNFALDFYQVN